MKRSHRLYRIFIALLIVGIFLGGMSLATAAPNELEPGGLIIPLGSAQSDLRAAYRAPLQHLYDGGRLHRVASDDPVSDANALPGVVQPGDLYLPPGEVETAGFCRTCTRAELSGTLTITRSTALYPGRVAVLRSTVMVDLEEGQVVAMWEIGEIRQLLDGYLSGAVPYDILTESEVAEQLQDYDLLIVPTFRSDARGEIVSLLDESGALTAIRTFVEGGGTLYAQGAGLYIAEAAGVLPSNVIDPYGQVELLPEDQFLNRGIIEILQPGSPLAQSLLTEELYILDDPILIPDDEGGQMEVVAQLTNAEQGFLPAVVRYPYGTGELIGVVGHPTDPTRRNEVPLFMNALLTALSGEADFYGDAIQTFNPLYPAHEFPAYEIVPVSATLQVENLWDETLGNAVVTETLSAGYTLTGTTVPAPTAVSVDAEGNTVIVWELGDLAPHAQRTLTYQAETDPEVLAAGVGTFSTGELAYTGLSGERTTVSHRPFILTARMAARLVGDRDLEADRHYRIPEEGIYLDVALPLENKEETLGSSLVLTDWVYLIVPIVDYAEQHTILNTNDGETIWMLNEPYLWGDDKYPQPQGAASPTQTYTLADWQGDWCVFTSTEGIHTDPPAGSLSIMADYGSFVTIPPTYTDYISVTTAHELLLPCLPLAWELGDFPAYWYEEPAVRYGVHSRELLGREVVFHGTPREGTVVMPYDAGSVYVLAGGDPVPFREHLEHADPYAAQPPTPALLTYQDVWSRTHTLELRAGFYDVWDWDSCATCSGDYEQHAGANLTYGLMADLDGDGTPETSVREIPTRLPTTWMTLLGKTYSAIAQEPGGTIEPTQNLIELPIFKGLGVMIRPAYETWWDSYRSLGPGNSQLISVCEQSAYDHLYFQQSVPLGSSSAFAISATIQTYPFNREGIFKLHDGARLVYRQLAAGPNKYEVYDSHVQAAEGWSSDGTVGKRVGPTLVSVYSDTLLFIYDVEDPYEPRSFEERYDPYLKSWGYGDLVWTTYVGGREEKTLFHSVLDTGDHARVRVALDNNTGMTLTNLTVDLDLPGGINATLLYTTPETAPEPIWPELAFLNRTEVPDAWRSVWYFDIEIGEVDEELWGSVIEIPVLVTADNLPDGYEAPPARIALQRPHDASPTFISGPAEGLVLTDTLPADVVLEAAALVTDTSTLNALQTALEQDAGYILSDTAGALFDTLAPTVAFTLQDNVATFVLPEALQQLPAAESWHLVAKATLLRAQHGPNVVNEGPHITYTDPFGVTWHEKGPGATVEAHGAAVWVEYECDDGWVASAFPGRFSTAADYNGMCIIPSDRPSEVWVDVTTYNAGDAIARGITVTLELPDGVTVTEATPPWHILDEEAVTWILGDLAPGAWKQFTIQLWVDPDEGEWEDEVGDFSNSALLPRRLMGIRQSDGAFTDDYSNQLIEGQVGDTLWFNVQFVPQIVYLPFVTRGYAGYPDLVVTELDATPDAVRVVIANQGDAAAAEGFWVDLYIAPETPPAAPNQIWQILGTQGMVWGITQPVAPGESITLTIDSPSYRPELSAVTWPLVPGTEIWAQVDSAHTGTIYGGILEDHEATGGAYNNIAGPIDVTHTSGSIRSSNATQALGDGSLILPPRP